MNKQQVDELFSHQLSQKIAEFIRGDEVTFESNRKCIESVERWKKTNHICEHLDVIERMIDRNEKIFVDVDNVICRTMIH